MAGTSAPYLTADMLPRELGPEVIALHLGTLGLVLEPMASTLTELVQRESGRRMVMLDPNIRPGLIDDSDYRARLREVIAQSTLVKTSRADLAWLYLILLTAGLLVAGLPDCRDRPGRVLVTSSSVPPQKGRNRPTAPTIRQP